MRATERFENVGGYRRDAAVAHVLGGLGFSVGDWDRLCSDFSGGWRMRIELVKLLLSAPTLLLLDELSDHLDSAAL